MDWSVVGCGIGWGFLWVVGAMLAMMLLCALAMRTFRGRHIGRHAACCMGHGRGGHHRVDEGPSPPTVP